MLSEERWKLIGYCEDCQAPLYFKEGEPLKAINPAPGCICHITVEEKEEEENV